ncbi:MAG: hypothetical protein LLG01_00125 [Planctomycetaceae bacterium]|nr:hypothetical protein [Planctomycetaceae bacterium]
MSQQKPQWDRQSDQADALAALAGGQPTAAGGQSKSPAAVNLSSGSRVPASAKRRRESAFQANAARAQAHQFKNFMIPMLLGAAVLLLLLGALAACNLPSDDYKAVHAEEVICKAWFKPLVIATFPLALILLAGAVVFWLDVRAHRKASAGG